MSYSEIVQKVQMSELVAEEKRVSAELKAQRALQRQARPGTLSMTEYLASFDDEEKKEKDVLDQLAADRAQREAADKEKKDAAQGAFPPPVLIATPE